MQRSWSSPLEPADSGEVCLRSSYAKNALGIGQFGVGKRTKKGAKRIGFVEIIFVAVRCDEEVI